MSLTKSKAVESGLCCESCQEEVNVHYCASCGLRFEAGDIIYCNHHSQSDCEHYHSSCKP